MNLATLSNPCPVFQPDVPRTPADGVTLSYVIKVIEDPAERAAARVGAVPSPSRRRRASAGVGPRRHPARLLAV
jgi:hypothetical protein